MEFTALVRGLVVVVVVTVKGEHEVPCAHEADTRHVGVAVPPGHLPSVGFILFFQVKTPPVILRNFVFLNETVETIEIISSGRSQKHLFSNGF